MYLQTQNQFGHTITHVTGILKCSLGIFRNYNFMKPVCSHVALTIKAQERLKESVESYTVREAILKKKLSKYGHYPEGGGGQPLPESFWSTFLMSSIFGHSGKGGGGKGLAKLFGAILKVLYC